MYQRPRGVNCTRHLIEMRSRVLVFEAILKRLDHVGRITYIVLMKQDYRHKNTGVSLINYHFVWCATRRRRIIVDRLEQRVKELVHEACATLDCKVIALETMPDHVYLFVNAPPDIAPSILIGRIKGYSSRILRQEFAVVQRMPSTWTRSFFVSTAGNVSSATVRKYIEEQKTRG